MLRPSVEAPSLEIPVHESSLFLLREAMALNWFLVAVYHKWAISKSFDAAHFAERSKSLLLLLRSYTGAHNSLKLFFLIFAYVMNAYKRVRPEDGLKWRPHAQSVESLNAFILEIDTSGIVMYANDACHLAFGLIEGELFFQRVVQSLDQFVARTQRLATKNLSVENLFASSIELAVTDREMIARVVIATVDGVYSEDGVIGYSLVMVPKPLSSTALESVLIQSLPAGIVATDLDGTIRCWNRGSNTLLGFTESEAVGKNIRELTKRSFAKDGEGIRSYI